MYFWDGYRGTRDFASLHCAPTSRMASGCGLSGGGVLRPESATAWRAASSRVGANVRLVLFVWRLNSLGSMPRKANTMGLVAVEAACSTLAATWGWGGLETTTMTDV